MQIQDALGEKIGSSQSRVAKIKSGNPSVSLDLIVRALLTSGATRQELAQVIVGTNQVKFVYFSRLVSAE